MAAGRPTDKYSNVAAITNLMNGVNVMSWDELLTGISLGQGVGMVIDQIDYWFDGIETEMVVETDRAAAGWAVSNAPASLISGAAKSDARIIHQCIISQPGDGTANNSGTNPLVYPITYQFFPGLIVAAPRLFFGAHSTGFAAAVTLSSRLYFRYLELTSQEYLELAEAFILVG